ncbi:hypothetical protein LSTR_LSTR013947 [Laodelphax striatellus]|uniref:Odorant receptor n=1 Tax=Laodelphax striatellus TaxID=195883 RepID=A0A482XSR9_LAOST|nr:hypothetical protein LSTR_LSTR013947 [Laodelphax striatellus]
MESTKFLRDYINFIRFDKQHSPIPYFLTMTVVLTINIGTLSAALNVESQDIKIAVLDQWIEQLMFFPSTIPHCVNPKSILQLLGLIDEEYFVSEKDFEHRVEVWKKIEVVYERRTRVMSLIYKLTKYILFMMYCAFCFRNAISHYFGFNDVQFPPSAVTPFLWFTEVKLEFSIHFTFVYVLQVWHLTVCHVELYLLQMAVCLPIERILADYEIIYILLDDFGERYSDSAVKYGNQDDTEENKKMSCMKEDMARIVKCHQHICRNYRILAGNAAYLLFVIVLFVTIDSCFSYYLMLKAHVFKKAMKAALYSTSINVALFYIYHNGQKIINQNDILRKTLTKIPWTDKPRWLKQTVYIMMTRANVDNEIKPYGIFVLNYNSFKDLMKTFYSVGNVLSSSNFARN